MRAADPRVSLGSHHDSDAVRARRVKGTARLPGPFRMRHGGSLPQVDIVYETWGTLSPAKDNALLITTGLSPGAHARSSAEDPTPGWWEEMVGPEQAIDTERFFVIGVNNLGGCHGSTGPTSIDRATGQPYGASFPLVTVEDWVASQARLMDRLGIGKLAAATAMSWCV